MRFEFEQYTFYRYKNAVTTDCDQIRTCHRFFVYRENFEPFVSVTRFQSSWFFSEEICKRNAAAYRLTGDVSYLTKGAGDE